MAYLKKERIREMRENRRAQIDERHMGILAHLEKPFGIDAQSASEWLLDAGQLEALNAFLEPKGATVLMATYADQNFGVQSSSTLFKVTLIKL